MNRAIPAVLLSLAMFGARAETFVPVLMYHRVTDTMPNSAYSITPDSFAAHLKVLYDAGYTTLTVADMAQRLYDKKQLPHRAVVLTFDDGWLEHARVVPKLLSEYAYTATFFVMGCHWGNKNYVDVNDVRALAESGHEIGGHSCTHDPSLSDVSRLDDAQWPRIAGEALLSRSEIQSYVGIDIRSYAFPYGLTTATASLKLARYGLKFLAETSAESRVTLSTPYASIPRVNVDGRTTQSDLLTVVRTGRALTY